MKKLGIVGAGDLGQLIAYHALTLGKFDKVWYNLQTELKVE